MEEDQPPSSTVSTTSQDEKIIMVLGPPASGKTTFIFSLLDNKYDITKQHTGIQCVKLSSPCKIQVWEGDVRVFQQLGKRLSGVVLVFDTARPSQQVELYDNFRPLVQSLQRSVQISIVGNKRGEVDAEKLRENTKQLFGHVNFQLVDFTDRAGVQQVFRNIVNAEPTLGHV